MEVESIDGGRETLSRYDTWVFGSPAPLPRETDCWLTKSTVRMHPTNNQSRRWHTENFNMPTHEPRADKNLKTGSQYQLHPLHLATHRGWNIMLGR